MLLDYSTESGIRASVKSRRVILITALLVSLALIPVAVKFSATLESPASGPGAKASPPVDGKATPETTRNSAATPKGAAEPGKPRLTPDELRRSLLEQAEKTLAGNLGGLDQASRAELEKLMTEADLRTLQERGFSHAHPMAFTGLAQLAVYLDRLSAFNQAEARELMLAYLDKRIKELESESASPNTGEVLDRWHRELSRDNGYEAVLIMGLEGRDKEGLKGALKFRRGLLVPAQ